MPSQEFWPFLYDIAYFGRAVFYMFVWGTIGVFMMHVIEEGFRYAKAVFIEIVKVSAFMTCFLAGIMLIAFTVIGTGIELWEYVSTWIFFNT